MSTLQISPAVAPQDEWSARSRHPLLYWTTIFYIVGLPNFLRFDATGRTHELGLFNATSISRIALTLMTAYVLIVYLAVTHAPILRRKLHFSIALWILYFAWCATASLLQPQSRLSERLATDLPLSLYRLAEWILGLLLILVLYSREPIQNATAFIVELIGRSSWITVLTVWLLLPVLPNLIYSPVEDDSLQSLLGGQFIIPGRLAYCACFAFFYALLFFRPGVRRWSGCLLSLVTLEMTRARTPQIGFIVALLCYALFFSPKASLRWATVGSLSLAAMALLAFPNTLLDYLLRGQKIQDITTLDSRTLVWQASIEAIRSRPFLGYGFVAGAKHAIRDHWIYTYWVPPNAHQEIIQALLVGGIPASILIAFLYLSGLWNAVRNVRRGPNHVFLFLTSIQLLFFALVASPNLSNEYSPMGAVFLLCWIGCAEMPWLNRTRAQGSNDHSVSPAVA
jgi:O-antigen ligase